MIPNSSLILRKDILFILLTLATACSTSDFKDVHFYVDQTKSNSAYYDELFYRVKKLVKSKSYLIISCDEDQLHNQVQNNEVSCNELNKYKIDRIVIDEHGKAVLFMNRLTPGQNYSVTIQQNEILVNDTITNRFLYKHVPGTSYFLVAEKD